MKKKSILNSPRLKELKRKRRRVRRNRVIFFAVCFLIIFFGLAFASRIDKINISEIKISGNKVIETEAVEKVVKENISGRYLWIFPKTNFLIYPKAKIKRELADKFKRFNDIKLSVQNIKTLEIFVFEREGKYTWCGAEFLEANEKCHFMDENGYIFDEAPYFSGEVYFRFYGPNASTDNPFGSYFLQNDFAKIISFKDTIEKMDLKPSAFELGNDGDANIYLSSGITPSISPKIIFKLDSDFNKLAENLQAAISTDPLQTDLKEKYNSLLYIDLRFGNKVYYKFSAEGESASGGQ